MGEQQDFHVPHNVSFPSKSILMPLIIFCNCIYSKSMDIRRCPFQQGVTNVNIPSSSTTSTYFQIHGCLEVYLQFAESQRFDRISFGIWAPLRMCMLSHEIHVTHWHYSIPNNFIFILRKHMLSSEICRRCMSASAVTLCKAFSKSSPWGPKKHFSQVTPSSFQI